MQTVVTGSPHDPLDDLRPLAAPKWEEEGSFTDIRYEVAEGMAKLTICRPERRNAFRPQTLFELTDAFTRRSAATTGTSATTRSASRGSGASTCSTCRS